MKSKVIWHVGGYNRNYGDFVLLRSIRDNLQQLTKTPLKFVSIDCQNTHFDLKLIEELNATADMLIIGGGGMVMNRHEDNSLSGWQWSIHSEDINKIKVPIIIYGIGYNKFNYDNRGFQTQLNESLKIAQKVAKLFSVRNNGTKDELISRELNADKMIVIPDSGMFITPKPIKVKFLNSNRMLVGINFVSDRPQYTYPPEFEKTRKVILDNIINTCKYLIQKYNALIVNIDHIPSLDFETNELFKCELGKDNYIVLSKEVPKIYPPSLSGAPYLAYIYSKMDLVLGMRGHSNIISFGMETPFLSIGSHNKNFFFTSQIGEEEYLINLRNYQQTATTECIIRKVEQLLKDSNYKKRTAKKRNQLKREFDDFNKKIINILEEK